MDADAEAVAVLERLISIAHRGEAITSQQEDSDQQCSICIQDLHILQEGVAQIVDEMIDVSARVVLETFGRRVERLLR